MGKQRGIGGGDGGTTGAETVVFCAVGEVFVVGGARGGVFTSVGYRCTIVGDRTYSS